MLSAFLRLTLKAADSGVIFSDAYTKAADGAVSNYQIAHADTTITRVTIKSGLSFQDHNVILNMIN